MTRGTGGFGFGVAGGADTPLPVHAQAVREGGAAALAGLAARDRLVAINGTPTAGLPHADVVALLKGVPAGGTLTLLVDKIAA